MAALRALLAPRERAVLDVLEQRRDGANLQVLSWECAADRADCAMALFVLARAGWVVRGKDGRWRAVQPAPLARPRAGARALALLRR